MADNTVFKRLVNLERLDDLFDEWMNSTFWDVSLSNNILTVYNKKGVKTTAHVKGDKGDPFTYDDFTPQQIAELQRPATDAIADCESAASSANTAARYANTAADLANNAADNANQKAQEADTAKQHAQNAADEWNNDYKLQVAQVILDAQGADKVDADLDGMTVTITGRDGRPKSVSIGYEIYNTYDSVAEMQADAANVPVGKLVIIATKDPTDEDNAKLYSRSSQGGFRFLADLDQASSEAWADWLNNHKQQIIDATNYALQQGDYAKTQGDHAKTQGEAAEGIYNEVSAWYGEDDQHGIRKTWVDWLADKLADWGAWKTARLTDYNQWKAGLNTDFADWFSDTLESGVRYIWNTWFAARLQDWNNLTKQATDDHTQAGEDHRISTEQSAYAKAQGDHAKEQGDRCETLNDHPQEIRSDGYVWAWDEETEAMVNTLRRIVATLDISSLTPEQKEDLINQFVLNLASVTEGQQVARGEAVAADDEKKVITLSVLKAYRDIIYGYVTDINDLIPSQATTENQLADKAFVNSTVATATATHRGTYNLVSDLHLTTAATTSEVTAALAAAISTADNNDYCYVTVPTADGKPTETARTDRYKHNGETWAFEYTLNSSGFTASEWEAIRSGMTEAKRQKLDALPTSDELTALLATKQDNLTFATQETCVSLIAEIV